MKESHQQKLDSVIWRIAIIEDALKPKQDIIPREDNIDIAIRRMLNFSNEDHSPMIDNIPKTGNPYVDDFNNEVRNAIYAENIKDYIKALQHYQNSQKAIEQAIKYERQPLMKESHQQKLDSVIRRIAIIEDALKPKQDINPREDNIQQQKDRTSADQIQAQNKVKQGLQFDQLGQLKEAREFCNSIEIYNQYSLIMKDLVMKVDIIDYKMKIQEPNIGIKRMQVEQKGFNPEPDNDILINQEIINAQSAENTKDYWKAIQHYIAVKSALEKAIKSGQNPNLIPARQQKLQFIQSRISHLEDAMKINQKPKIGDETPDKQEGGQKRHPTIGSEIIVGSGAKILGPLTIGNNVRIGAGSVVLKDVDDGCTVVGVPGRVVKTRSTGVTENTALNHEKLPDINAHAMRSLFHQQLQTAQDMKEIQRQFVELQQELKDVMNRERNNNKEKERKQDQSSDERERNYKKDKHIQHENEWSSDTVREKEKSKCISAPSVPQQQRDQQLNKDNDNDEQKEKQINKIKNGNGEESTEDQEEECERLLLKEIYGEIDPITGIKTNKCTNIDKCKLLVVKPKVMAMFAKDSLEITTDSESDQQKSEQLRKQGQLMNNINNDKDINKDSYLLSKNSPINKKDNNINQQEEDIEDEKSPCVRIQSQLTAKPNESQPSSSVSEGINVVSDLTMSVPPTSQQQIVYHTFDPSLARSEPSCQTYSPPFAPSSSMHQSASTIQFVRKARKQAVEVAAPVQE
ncbi:MAG: Serine O-acetyltransferase [Streblomastix strix]|uniref:Serine O-acetyltransferase n=1 Tax=Streblomastix strix TaxID=222440 RepID=A0A5J4WC83_9EUKA|nr:MAG: Serine O-acetyltransferase [Streblomastix strix]